VTEFADYPPAMLFPPSSGGLARKWPHLVVMNYPGLGEVFRLVQPESIVGRAEDADVRPFHGTVSRKHARLTVVGERVVIEDLGSANGTSVNDDRVQSQRILNEGDVIALGEITALRLVYANILDQALRRSGYEEAGGEIAKRAENAEQFFDRIRIEMVRAAASHFPLTLVLFRLDRSSPTVEDSEGRVNTEEAMRRFVAIVRDAMWKGRIMARPSPAELVMFTAMPAAQAGAMADRIRERVERAKTLNSEALGSTTMTAGVLPVPIGECLAPETILCAAGDQVRRAMAGEINRVLALPMLNAHRVPTGPTTGERSSP
jgi:GGDEF domain-containing protein